MTPPDYVCPNCGGPKTGYAKQCQTCFFRMSHVNGDRVVANVVCLECGGYKNQKAKVCMDCYRKTLSDDRPLSKTSGQERARYGCIVSFENEAGLSLVIHKKGPVRKSVRAACEEALAHDPSFLVTAISTPESVFTDLQGARQNKGVGGRFGYAQMPEAAHLTGPLKAMLHPRLAR